MIERGRERHHLKAGNASHMWPTFASAAKSLALSSLPRSDYWLRFCWAEYNFLRFFVLLLLVRCGARSGRIIPWEAGRSGARRSAAGTMGMCMGQWRQLFTHALEHTSIELGLHSTTVHIPHSGGHDQPSKPKPNQTKLTKHTSRIVSCVQREQQERTSEWRKLL